MRFTGVVGSGHWFLRALVGACSIAAFSANARAEITPSEVAISPDPASGPAPRASPPPSRHGAVFIDPLGLLLFGPSVGVELGGGHFAAALSARWFNVGLLSHALFVKQNEEFAFSYGAGAVGRYYLREGLAGPSLGLGVELVHSVIEDSVYRVTTTSLYLVPEAEAGYHVALGPVALGPALAVGYAFRARASVSGADAALFSPSNESTLYGSARFDVGLWF